MSAVGRKVSGSLRSKRSAKPWEAITATVRAWIPPVQPGSPVPPTPPNGLGVKGFGEAGTIASSVAVINAICDSLAPLGIKHVDMPASPDRLWKQILESRHGNGHSAQPIPSAGSEQAVPAQGETPMPGSLTEQGTAPHAGLAAPEGGPGTNQEDKA